jgi:CubicO group peptidase (beta-lactamase class C family)
MASTKGISKSISKKTLSTLCGILERHVASRHASGVVALAGCGEESHVLAVGTKALSTADAMPRDAIFRITSMTKPITAAAAMMLIEEGKLRLQEPVDQLLPELAKRQVLKRIDSALDDTVPADRPITLQDVLTFRLGLGILMARPGTHPIQRAIAELGLVGFGPPDPTVSYDPHEWIRRLGTLPLMAQPGERWMYSAGSNVLGVLIARASGRSLPEFLQDRIFEPLGMRDSAFFVPAAKLDRLPTQYRATAEGLAPCDEAANSAWSKPPMFPAGESGLVSTIEDYFAFSRFLSRKGRVGSHQLLSEDSIDAMTHDHLTPAQRSGAQTFLGADHGWGYGLGVALRLTADGEPLGSFGWGGGFGTSWLVDPGSDRTAIVMTQTMQGSPEPPSLHQDIWREVFRSS